MGYSKIISKLGKDRVRLDEPVAKHTTFKIGGPADVFYEAKTEEELIRVIRLIRGIGMPYFIWGGGSNILVSDKGFRGIVIKMKNEKLKISKAYFLASSKIKNERLKCKIIAEAGVPLARVVQLATENSLSGLEFLVGIPGTVGGAIRGNAGTVTEWIEQVIEKVKILDEEEKVRWLARRECGLAYRQSRFKKSSEVILKVVLRVNESNQRTIKVKTKAYLEKKLSQPRELSAGCVFKNPPYDSAGRLIDEAGLKGFRIGRAQISPLHANFIVNLGGATCQDVLKLIALAKKKVKEKFGVKLKEEIEIVGEF